MIGDDIAARLPELQAQAESMMLTPCTIRRPTGVTSDDDGRDVVAYEPQPVYEGRCRVRHRQGVGQGAQESADSYVVVQQYELHVPVAAGPFLVGDVAEVEARRFRIAGLNTATFQTAQRLPVTEET